jgi:hypothetical protein
MAVAVKTKQKKKIPAPGRKMTRQEARDYAFRKFGPAMKMLAKN